MSHEKSVGDDRTPVKPVKPGDLDKRPEVSIPDEVIMIFNDVITKNYRNGEATVKVKDVIERVATILRITREQVFERRLLDVEKVFEKHGWRVTYDQPSYGDSENFDAYYKFKKATRGVRGDD